MRKIFDDKHSTSIYHLTTLQQPQQAERRCHFKDGSINLWEGNMQFYSECRKYNGSCHEKGKENKVN